MYQPHRDPVARARPRGWDTDSRPIDLPGRSNNHRARCVNPFRRGASQLLRGPDARGTMSQFDVIRATHHPITRGLRHVCPGPEMPKGVACIKFTSLKRHALLRRPGD